MPRLPDPGLRMVSTNKSISILRTILIKRRKYKLSSLIETDTITGIRQYFLVVKSESTKGSAKREPTLFFGVSVTHEPSLFEHLIVKLELRLEL